MIVVCDTFHHNDYPVYVMPNQKVKKVGEGYDERSSQKIIEVYNLSMNMENQLNKDRVFNY
jgi:hypothetical protein